MTWTFDWPAAADADKASAGAELVALAESYAAAAMRMLTLQRVGGLPITVMPCGRTCTSPLMKLEMFSPAPFYPSARDLKACNCYLGCGCSDVGGVALTGPVGDIVEVKLYGTVLDPSEYRVEDDRLIRNNGEAWPACGGKDFLVTYLNARPVDAMGAYAGGVLAWEFLKMLTADRKCRLSSSVKAVNRQGIQMEMTPGLFPEGVTGIEEVDIYLRQWNPHGQKVAPKVYSLDLPRQREVSWGAF